MYRFGQLTRRLCVGQGLAPAGTNVKERRNFVYSVILFLAAASHRPTLRVRSYYQTSPTPLSTLHTFLYCRGISFNFNFTCADFASRLSRPMIVGSRRRGRIGRWCRHIRIREAYDASSRDFLICRCNVSIASHRPQADTCRDLPT